MRKIKIENAELLEILDSKSELSKQAEPILKEMQEIAERNEVLNEDFNKIVSKQARNDEKAKPYINELLKDIELAEFESVSGVKQSEDGTWNIEIADRMEEFKVKFKEEQEELKKLRAEETGSTAELEESDKK